MRGRWVGYDSIQLARSFEGQGKPCPYTSLRERVFRETSVADPKIKQKIFSTIVALGMMASAFCLRAAPGGPAGQQTQQALTKLSASTMGEFEAAFDAGADGPRVILQASPT
jgi:hypothetical protein